MRIHWKPSHSTLEVINYATFFRYISYVYCCSVREDIWWFKTSLLFKIDIKRWSPFFSVHSCCYTVVMMVYCSVGNCSLLVLFFTPYSGDNIFIFILFFIFKLCYNLILISFHFLLLHQIRMYCSFFTTHCFSLYTIHSMWHGMSWRNASQSNSEHATESRWNFQNRCTLYDEICR